MAIILPIHNPSPLVQHLKNGSLAAFPTDTVYGIGCPLQQVKTLDRLYALKNRQENQPTALLFSDTAMVFSYAAKELSSFKSLLDKFWPGPLTIILYPKNDLNIDKRLLGNKGTIGVRIPNYPPLQKLISLIGMPLVASSANYRGKAPLSSENEINATFMNAVDFVFSDKNYHPKGIASTIIDITTGTISIIREGAISTKALELS